MTPKTEQTEKVDSTPSRPNYPTPPRIDSAEDVDHFALVGLLVGVVYAKLWPFEPV